MPEQTSGRHPSSTEGFAAGDRRSAERGAGHVDCSSKGVDARVGNIFEIFGRIGNQGGKSEEGAIMLGEQRDLQWFRTSGSFVVEEAPKASRTAGLLAGLVGGFVATLAMDGFQSLMNQVGGTRRDERTPRDAHATSGAGEDEPSTAKLGRRLSQRVLHRELDEESARLASEATSLT